MDRGEGDASEPGERPTREADELFEWVKEQGILEDPDRIPKLYREARRRWGHLTTRYGLGEILRSTLEKMGAGARVS